ncbi:hypothetical protein M2324_003640 [Rhodovulum sulfidophilum]|uniref:hypothetical protein n=1 Tax=Rhodovulum sulfidophilum TaxID=35806 RepID=UPI0005A815D4|nr:hypothetical protein [Rhodovulum sulfidophilum]ANB33251.1 hypothetical protein A6W98_03640 [Rhodovulum sulfidophilum DSM 1374]ANB37099.1 hypothetical protein A6024_03625 [Rhodovulum sulfidophilum]MCW2305221.1 hypothetical protein [Rhodovulum sulfidophilum]
MSDPWLKFYTSDWRSDPGLRMCGLAARGLWVEMICLMHEATLEGDIAERCRIEMRAVRAARVRARSGWAGTEAPEDRERCSPEAAARAMRAAGFSPAEDFTGPKRFGGAADQRGAA